MAEKTNVPEIRFAGFTDPWEQRKLGNCGTTYSGLSGKTKEDFGHGSARFVPYTNVFDNPLTDTKRLEAVEIDSSQNKIAYGDVFFTVSSETPDEVGMSSVWLSDQEDVYLNSFCFGYRQDSTFDSHYLAYMLRSSSIRSNLALLAQGISRFNISKNKVMELSVPVPSAVEQKQIGQYFARLDNLITLHQRKYDKLCAVKKSMLDKMFPKPGETEPEIRFAGFTDPWEQRKLGEIAPVTMGQSPNGACYTDNPNDVVLVQGNADLKDGWVSPRVWTTEITKTAKSGDLIMSVRAPVGAMGQTAYDVVLGRGVAGIVGNEFLFQALSKKEAEGYWSTVSAGSTFDSINGDELRSTPIDCPRSETECEAIGNCLSKVDYLITLHQREPPHMMKEGKNANQYQRRIPFL